jgi:multidrug efflux pump
VLKSELAPVEDRGVLLGVFLGPDGATLDYTDKYARQIEGIYSQTKDIERFFVVSGSPTVNQGISFVGLTDWKERDRRSPDVARELFPKFMGIPGRPRLSGDAALAGPEPARAADQFRHRHLGLV